jgi:hypothetical protein
MMLISPVLACSFVNIELSENLYMMYINVSANVYLYYFNSRKNATCPTIREKPTAGAPKTLIPGEF